MLHVTCSHQEPVGVDVPEFGRPVACHYPILSVPAVFQPPECSRRTRSNLSASLALTNGTDCNEAGCRIDVPLHLPSRKVQKPWQYKSSEEQGGAWSARNSSSGSMEKTPMRLCTLVVRKHASARWSVGSEHSCILHTAQGSLKDHYNSFSIIYAHH